MLAADDYRRHLYRWWLLEPQVSNDAAWIGVGWGNFDTDRPAWIAASTTASTDRDRPHHSIPLRSAQCTSPRVALVWAEPLGMAQRVRQMPTLRLAGSGWAFCCPEYSIIVNR